jgi:tRNA threonylcarbamoyladenosine biosynthesis protein TsaE
MMKIKSDSPSKTKKLGYLLAKEILKENFNLPIIIGLKGNLGSGKTTFIQGFSKGLGLKNKITSPTFVIFRHYELKNKSRKHLFHMDAYRIRNISELAPLNFKEMVSAPGAVVMIEWPENISKALPKNILWLEFHYGLKENERIIIFGK